MILLTGATGYVGGRLLSALESHPYPVRCLARHPHCLVGQTGPWTQVVSGDLLDPGSVAKAMRGVDTAYYLAHSQPNGSDFTERDRASARNFGEAARRAGVRRIIYLGRLGHGPGLSPYLKSRQDVGNVLRASGLHVIEFRTSIILGAGSPSFELIRALVEPFPVTITPGWFGMTVQPISIMDLLEYLVSSLDLEVQDHRVFEIGGADQVSYLEIMREYARQRGLSRLMIPVPFLTTRLTSLWLTHLTQLEPSVSRILLASGRHPQVIKNRSAREFFPIDPDGTAQAIREALAEENREYLLPRQALYLTRLSSKNN